VGHNKGRTTEEKRACHFGCAHPEGYRKALAKMRLAEKFGLPIVTLVDTPGAYPGLGAEERGQAEAIAVNLREMSRLRVPVVSVVIGEGGSGGALGLAVADRVVMLEHAWYSVISPEGCAAILWKQANEQTNDAAAKAPRPSRISRSSRRRSGSRRGGGGSGGSARTRSWRWSRRRRARKIEGPAARRRRASL